MNSEGGGRDDGDKGKYRGLERGGMQKNEKAGVKERNGDMFRSRIQLNWFQRDW